MIGWKSVLVYGLSLGLCLPPLTLHAAEPALRAGRELNRIENPSGPAVIQTDKGTVISNNTTNIVQGIEPEKYAELAKQLGVTEQALATFFATIERQNVSLADLDATLRQIAEHYKALLERLRTLSSADQAVAQLRDAASAAVQAGEFDRAERLLNEASAHDQAAATALEAELSRMQEARTQRRLSAAAAKAANGDLKNTQLAYAAAAAYYGEAAALVPEDEALVLARYLNEQGYAFVKAGRYPEARPPFEQALAVHEKVLGPEHPGTATSLNNLGSLLRAQGELTAVRPYYARALAVSEKVLGPDHPNTATSLNNLVSLLHAQGELTAARPYYRFPQ